MDGGLNTALLSPLPSSPSATPSLQCLASCVWLTRSAHVHYLQLISLSITTSAISLNDNIVAPSQCHNIVACRSLQRYRRSRLYDSGPITFMYTLMSCIVILSADFICGLSDVIIKTFSQSVSNHRRQGWRVSMVDEIKGCS